MSINAALSFLLSQQSAELNTISPEPKGKPVKGGRPGKINGTALPNHDAKAKQVSNKEANPEALDKQKERQEAVAALFSLNLPAVGTYDAAGYLKALRHASTRNEKVQALAGYVGFDKKQDYGMQEFKARSKAVRELKPLAVDVNEAPYSRAGKPISPDAARYVKGKPDIFRKREQDLLKRHELSFDAMKIHQTKATDGNAANEAKELHAGLAEIEAERQKAIREDLYKR